jgi:catechol 2,3-dioxygenase-like lactoylglutathione lyase family enzyme
LCVRRAEQSADWGGKGNEKGFGSGSCSARERVGTTLGEGLETDVMREVTGSLVALSTPDVGRAAKWYEEKLGFHLVKAGQMGKGLQFTLLRHEDNIVELIQNPQAQPLEKAVPGIKDSFEVHGIFKLGFTVRKFDDVFAELKKRGVRIDFEATQLNDLGLRAFGIRDADGNLIQFFGR